MQEQILLLTPNLQEETLTAKKALPAFQQILLCECGIHRQRHMISPAREVCIHTMKPPLAASRYSCHMYWFGTDYWSYATDFDGTALGGSSRAVSVKFASGATATFGLERHSKYSVFRTASTSIDRQSSGNYGITLNGATINAQYYLVRNMNATGMNLTGSTTITSL